MSRSVKLVCVDPKLVHLIWPRVSNKINDAIAKGGGDNFKGTEQNVLNGDALLWLAWDGVSVAAAAVTEILKNGTCEIVAFAGKRCDDLLSGIEDHARAEGCAKVRFTGRKGWARVLPEYSQPYIVLERML